MHVFVMQYVVEHYKGLDLYLYPCNYIGSFLSFLPILPNTFDGMKWLF